jgi:poly-beta-hydroxyalkanoate depolymerase
MHFLDLHNVFFENYFANELTMQIDRFWSNFNKTFAVRVLSDLKIVSLFVSLNLIKHCCSCFKWYTKLYSNGFVDTDVSFTFATEYWHLTAYILFSWTFWFSFMSELGDSYKHFSLSTAFVHQQGTSHEENSLIRTDRAIQYK